MAASNQLLIAAVLALALLAAPSAQAQTVPPPDAARTIAARTAFEEGVAFARTERWSEAVEAFQRSRALVDRPGTTLNVALGLRQLGRLREARQVLRACVAMSETAAEPDIGRDAALLLGVITDAIATLSLTVDAEPFTVQVDHEPAADPRALELDPGSHTVTVSAPGRVPATFSLEVATGARIARTIRLPPQPARIDVTVTPPDAQVYIDGVAIGQGRARWEGPAGTVRLRASRAGHHGEARDVTVAPGAQAFERLNLVRVRRPITSRPWFWAGIGAAVVVLAGVTAAVVLSTGGAVPVDGGSTGAVLYAF